jgi:hypothetical protein
MHAGGSDALERLIGLIVVGHLIGGLFLDVLAGVGATIEKRPRHRTKMAQTKTEKPQPDRAGAKSADEGVIQAGCSAEVNWNESAARFLA